ncbi:hypothetical protein CC80DRAFT_507862 [Byssothecium circinans]|uniref:Piwi domain-containing protein n=1 Tax=Byssothecium circinans TaxID=147558 RepID=A0A6A5TUT0_9PLEO|nr:hypothetical protein CC80DRAFT_507862 [Byssothecium circinans]
MEPIEKRVNGVLPNGDLIVVGAHITFPTSEYGKYHPSVSSLVMSKGRKTPFIYISSAQVQQASHTVFDNQKKSSKARDRFKIDGLQDRLTELFTDWKLRHPSKELNAAKLKPRLSFYRDSYRAVDGETYLTEAKKITAAYAHVFGGKDEEVPLSFILSTRHTHDYKIGKNRKSEVPFHFTTQKFSKEHTGGFGVHVADDDAGKYQYTVVQNSDFSQVQLQKLTATLNMSHDLCSCTAIALPIHFARKLGKRVMEYCNGMEKLGSGGVSDGDAVAEGSDAGDRVEKTIKRVNGFLEVNVDGTKVRGDGKAKTRPWNKGLDDLMFYL